MSRFILIILFIVSSFTTLKAQTKGAIEGYITGSEDTASVEHATVSVFNTRDSSMVNFGLTDADGAFELGNLPLHVPLRLLISHVLYNQVIYNFTLSDSQPVHKPDTFFLPERSLLLAEAVITWEVPPILIRNDTVEFNADAFLTRPGSVVEDLLKRIPGLEIDENGSMTINGRTVSKITLDSKQFFSDDPAILLKNLPAKAIEKIQVSEERDEFGRLTNSGDVSINLTLKKWAKTGHFGKAFAGYGTDKRYEGGGIWNFFRDTLQVSVLGYGNNLSNAGFSFSDLYSLGGFNRSGVNRLSIDNNGNYEVNGSSFGGGRGITESGGGGFNLNYDLPRKLHLSTSYFMGFSDTKYTNFMDRKTFLGDSTLSTFESTNEKVKTANHTVNLNVTYTPDTIHRFYLQPLFSIKKNDLQRGISSRNAYSNSPDRSFFNNTLQEKNHSWNFSNSMGWGASWKKTGLSLAFVQNLDRSDGSGLNNILRQYLDTGFAEDYSQQERNFDTYTDFLGVYTALSHKLGEKITLEVEPGYEYTKKVTNTLIFEQDSLTGQTSVLLPEFSTQFTEQRNYMTSYQGLVFKFTKDTRLRVGTDVSRVDLDLENALKSSAVKRRFDYLLPTSIFNFVVKKVNFRAVYKYNYSIPNSFNLLDVTDNRNPNRISTGNPNLEAYRGHDASLRASLYNTKSKLNFNSNIYYSKVMNQVTYRYFYDELGRQINRPENLPDGYENESLNINGNIRKTLQQKKYTQQLAFSGGVYRRKTFSYINQDLFRTFTTSANAGLSYSFLNKDRLDAKVSYSPSLSFSRVEGLSGLNRRFNQQVNVECWVAITSKFWAETQFTYTYQTISSTTFVPRNAALLNASITRLLLKEGRGQLRFSVFDILKQNKSLSREVNSNFTTEAESNVVTRYFMLSFIYNFHQLGTTGRTQKGISFY